MKKEYNVFLTDDITRADHEQDDSERYEYTENVDDFLNFVIEDDRANKDQKATAKALLSQFDAGPDDDCIEAIEQFIEECDELDKDGACLFGHWADQVSYDSQWQAPMMNCLRYFPEFVSFTKADRYKTVGCTTLLYDREREAWAVGMTGGGMDLSPYLLATFIRLGKGVPTELASSIRRDYSANMNKAEHERNCDLLARAYVVNAIDELNRSTRLAGGLEEEIPLHRHIIAIRKTLDKTA